MIQLRSVLLSLTCQRLASFWRLPPSSWPESTISYFGDFFDGLYSFHADFDLLEVFGGEAELCLEEEGGGVLESISQHGK